MHPETMHNLKQLWSPFHCANHCLQRPLWDIALSWAYVRKKGPKGCKGLPTPIREKGHRGTKYCVWPPAMLKCRSSALLLTKLSCQRKLSSGGNTHLHSPASGWAPAAELHTASAAS
eukprot:1160732-Pelagomonas_calceolata.AAC.2